MLSAMTCANKRQMINGGKDMERNQTKPSSILFNRLSKVYGIDSGLWGSHSQTQMEAEVTQVHKTRERKKRRR